MVLMITPLLLFAEKLVAKPADLFDDEGAIPDSDASNHADCADNAGGSW